ncbi:MAG TPA: Mur ligase family protein, partial [Candidatus Saccharimonadales bacterium]|nr:Mur ligase family protein [Candidatus Saccharimonadales bacterium]
MNLRGIVGLYGWNMPSALVSKLRSSHYSGWRVLSWFWQTASFRGRAPLNDADQSLVVVLWLGMLTQIGFGVGFLVEWARFGTAGAWEFGAALLLSYPIVWVHVLALGASIVRLVYLLLHPKKLGRAVVCAVLESQVRRLRRRHHFKVVAVCGSVGKTSTKLAIADLLGQGLRVRHQAGNYNDRVTVPLVFFGQREPSLFNPIAWLQVFGANNAEIAFPYPYDVVVVELGTDAPGQLEQFAYLKPDIAVVTAATPEHMEFFRTLDAVAAEELTVFDYAKRVLVNGDDIPGAYLAGRKFVEYSMVSKQAQYYAKADSHGLHGQTLHVTLPKGEVTAEVQYVGKHAAKFALAATAVAHMLGLKRADITEGLPKLQPFAGRMQILPGIKDSTLIDDTYNASPIAVKAALDVVYAARVPQRIAILGSMNELGDYSPEAHREVGAYCNPKKLDLVVTVGDDAKKWLAPVARAAGCEVRSFTSPY